MKCSAAVMVLQLSARRICSSFTSTHFKCCTSCRDTRPPREWIIKRLFQQKCIILFIKHVDASVMHVYCVRMCSCGTCLTSVLNYFFFAKLVDFFDMWNGKLGFWADEYFFTITSSKLINSNKKVKKNWTTIINRNPILQLVLFILYLTKYHIYITGNIL